MFEALVKVIAPTAEDAQALREAFSTVSNLSFTKNYAAYFRLKKSDGSLQWGGNLEHFINVVTATFHAIHYAETVLGETFTPERKRDLLVCAFYHDLGKTNTDHRHAMEGQSMFEEQKASTIYQFEQLDIPADKLPYYAVCVGSHDIEGTIATGENSLLSIAAIVERFSELFNGDAIAVRNAVVDWWLLNVADIAVSIKKKFNPQQEWWLTGQVRDLPEHFDECGQSFKWKCLVDDLQFALQIAGAADGAFRAAARRLSEQQAVERFRRLAWDSLGAMAVDVNSLLKAVDPALATAIVDLLESPAVLPKMAAILRNEFGGGYKAMFGTMLQFDYALGFFREVAKRAVYWVTEEIKTGVRTCLMYNQKTPNPTKPPYPPQFMVCYNAECIVNSYMMFLVSVFGEIRKLTADIENWNIEFEDAKNRLNTSKADNLLFINGAYRAANTRVLLMREIMLYK